MIMYIKAETCTRVKNVATIWLIFHDFPVSVCTLWTWSSVLWYCRCTKPTTTIPWRFGLTSNSLGKSGQLNNKFRVETSSNSNTHKFLCWLHFIQLKVKLPMTNAYIWQIYCSTYIYCESKRETLYISLIFRLHQIPTDVKIRSLAEMCTKIPVTALFEKSTGIYGPTYGVSLFWLHMHTYTSVTTRAL